MKIKDYEKITSLKNTDILLVDTNEGTKTILYADLINAIKYDDDIPVEQRRKIWRGKKLTNFFTSTTKAAIRDGSFKGLFLGDYIEVEEHVIPGTSPAVTFPYSKWRIMDFDYWYGVGNPNCTTHHVVFMPDQTLMLASMNPTNTTAGGYKNAAIRNGGMNNVDDMITELFHFDILEHKELISTQVTDGKPSSSSWESSTFELPCELMIYGTRMFSASGVGDTSSCTVLAGLACNTFFINPTRTNYWLRDVGSPSHFVDVSGYNVPSIMQASNQIGIRPVVGVTG